MKKILILFVSALLAVSCSGFLEEQVYSQHTPDNAYNTPEGANKALAACYSWLRHSFDNKWSAGFGELGTDEATSYNDSYGDHESQLDDYTYTAEYDWIDAVYGSCYGGIKCCNIVIDLVPNTMEGYDLMVAQAKFLRAVYYFELVNLYGGVPLWLTANADKDNLELPRSSVEEVYEVIISDLTEAEEVLPAVKVWDGEAGRATKYAAQAMLARVYLQLHDYENAIKYCDLVIGDGNNFFLDSYADIFDPAKKNSGRENIFEIQNRISMKSEDMGSTIQDFYLPIELQGTIYTGWAMYGPTEYLYNSYEPGDIRKEITFFTKGVNAAGDEVTFRPHVFKYYNRTSGVPVNDGEQNFPFLRYADILLMKAEAINGLPSASADQIDAKFDCLNQVRRRAGLPEIRNEGDNATKEGFLETLLLERMHELCFEKCRRRDLIRNDKLVSYVQLHKPERPVPEKAKLYYPLPRAATDANSLLKEQQLPGY